ncbi:MAG TPA: glycosyltransferase [Acidobacteriota bacterium]|nr:glycosyltransferase [Acidobacteriota bacterium]
MSPSEILFWVLAIVVFYSYVGYGAAVLMIGSLRRLFSQPDKAGDGDYEPFVTLFVASYNEEHWVERKIRNSMELEYPVEKLDLLWVTDGSDDSSADLIRKHPRIIHLHSAVGKAAAITGV